MSQEKIEVSLTALKNLLTALVGPPHYIREIQALRGMPNSTNCIDILIEDYNNFVEKNKG